MSQYDSDWLIAQVKRRATIPTSQSLFTADKLILMLNDELQTRLVPLLMSMRDEWYVSEIEYTGDGSTTAYRIPTSAVGSKLRAVTLWTVGENKPKQNVPRLDPTNLHEAYFGFYLKGQEVIFYPNAIDQNTKIRLSYFRRVNDIVSTSAAGLVSSVAGNDVTIATTPPSTFQNGTTVDIIDYSSPFRIKATTTISNIVSSTLTLADGSEAEEGDWICISGESVFAELPSELLPALCQSVVVRIMEALGDKTGLEIALSSYNQIEMSAKAAFSPKVDGSPVKMQTRGRISRLIP